MYTKLFRSITSSSVWIEDSDTVKLWVFLLAEADLKGYVFGSLVTVADRCKVPVEKTRAILAKFAAPDPYSSDLTRKPENDGRRIEVVEGGWLVINLEYYRDLQDSDVRREQVREANKRLRERKKAPRKQRDHARSPVINSDHARSPVIPTEADAATDADAAKSGGTTSLSGQLVVAPRDLAPSKKQSADPDLHRRAEAFVRYFRQRYHEHVDPDYRFSEHLPAADVTAAKYLLRHWKRERLAEIIAWTVKDRGNGRWPGWAKQIRSVANLKEHIAKLDQQAREADKPPPDDDPGYMGEDIDDEENANG